MEKLSWKAPTLEDLDKIRLAAEINNQSGNEMSAVNLFLYQIKYDTKIAFFDDMSHTLPGDIFTLRYFRKGKVIVIIIADKILLLPGEKLTVNIKKHNNVEIFSHYFTPLSVSVKIFCFTACLLY